MRIVFLTLVLAIFTLLSCKDSHSGNDLKGHAGQRERPIAQVSVTPDKVEISGYLEKDMDIKIIARKYSTSEWPKLLTNDCYPQKARGGLGGFAGYVIGEDTKVVDIQRKGKTFKAVVDFSDLHLPKECLPRKSIHIRPISVKSSKYEVTHAVSFYEKGFDHGYSTETRSGPNVSTECKKVHYVDTDKVALDCPMGSTPRFLGDGMAEHIGVVLGSHQKYIVNFSSNQLEYSTEEFSSQFATSLSKLNDLSQAMEDSSISQKQKKRLKNQVEDGILILKREIKGFHARVER